MKEDKVTKIIESLNQQIEHWEKVKEQTSNALELHYCNCRIQTIENLIDKAKRGY